MAHTTPPRPVDIAAEVPTLAPLARVATRLHPRPGSPSPRESSVGGPLLWPVSETWPHCDGPHAWDGANLPRSVADVRLERRIQAAATEQERNALVREREARAELRRPPRTERPRTEPAVAQPYAGAVPMLPVAQLYARDVPGLPAPAGADLLQVLWCSFDHAEDSLPRTALFWRSADEVTRILTDPPAPEEAQYPGYVPDPCTLDPEQVTEYPAPLELDPDLREQVALWCVRHSTGREPNIEDLRAAQYVPEADVYADDLCCAPGWKVGGWIRWGLNDPYPQPCPACGTPTEPLLTIAGQEWDRGTYSWIPYQDRATVIPDRGPTARRRPSRRDLARRRAAQLPSGLQIGRGYDQVIRVCPASSDHPHRQLMQ